LAWDANRPIPWRRLLKEATIFLVIGVVAIAVFTNEFKPSTLFGLVVGMVFYVLFVAVLSKFGYQRQSIREARDARQSLASTATATSQTARQRPAPTRRTSTGPSQRPNRSTKKRRR
jgi:glycerol uptake facilitator-like aquaporin